MSEREITNQCNGEHKALEVCEYIVYILHPTHRWDGMRACQLCHSIDIEHEVWCPYPMAMEALQLAGYETVWWKAER